ncbi:MULTISPECIES: ArnT family glycosyltransferase [Cyanophyceae]|uniref:ArnT family glycosyltransferase n=1 Tax=Cyanophyceae TaxID=3028117 RepID=UPI0016880D7D|nr:glycosyltransferase family 39 protein [Trichocoleus sp. FACHB-69]MBD1935140.1 glycosyltransferase family 39 protein [Trichocoleus sp. FACHB-69]
MKFRVDQALRRGWKYWDKHPGVAWTLSILWVLGVCWLAFVWNVGSIGLIDETEPLFAEAARQMTVTGDWITPFFNGETRFDKPPLVYWLMAIAYKSVGVNEWAVRLPSALSAIAVTGLAFYTLRYFGATSGVVATGQSSVGKRTPPQLWLSALLGAALIALNPEMIVWGRTGVSDMLLTGCMGCAILSFFLGYAQPSRPAIQSRWYLAFYVLVALAILAKGPVGIVLPVLIIGTFLLYLGNFWQVLREMRPIRGLAIVLALAVPWYVLVIWRNGEAYIDKFFGYHNFERFTGVVNDHWAPWYFYFLVVLLGFAPWSIYLPIAIARLRFWKRDRWRQQPRSAQLGLFALFWFAGIFGFFTVAVTKLPSYVLPLMPAAGILVALLFSEQMTFVSRPLSVVTEESSSLNPQTLDSNNLPIQPSHPTSKNKGLFWSGIVNVVFLAVLAGGILYSPNFLGYDPAVPDLQQLVQNSGLPVRGFIIWGAAAVSAAVLLWRRWWRWLWSPNLIGFMAFIIFVLTPAYFMMDNARQLPLRELSAIAAQVERPGEPMVMIGFKKPSVVFYTQRPVNYFAKASSAMEYIEAISASEAKPPSVLILTEPKYLQQTKLAPHQYQTLGKVGAYQLIRISKQMVAWSEAARSN